MSSSRPAAALAVVFLALAFVSLPAAADDFLGVALSDSPDPVTPGSSLALHAVVTNLSATDTAPAPELILPLPAGTTFAGIANGGWTCTTPAVGANGTVSCSVASFGPSASVTIDVTVVVDPSVAPGTLLTTTATLITTEDDPNPEDNVDTETTLVVSVASVNLDLGVLGPIAAGSNIPFEIHANNEGPTAAINTVVSFTIPAESSFVSLAAPAGWTCTTPAVGTPGATITCSTPAFAPGTATFPLQASTDPSLPAGTISASGSISTASVDPDPDDNGGTYPVNIVTAADVAVTIDGTPDPVTAGQNVTWTVGVVNNGPSTAQSVTLTAPLDAATTFVSIAAPAGWTCTTPAVGATGTIVCSVASMVPGNASFSVIARVDPAASGTIAGNASVTTTTSDTFGANDNASDTVSVAIVSDLRIAKSAGAFASPFPWILSVANDGPSRALNVTMTDVLSAPAAFAAITAPPGWTCTTPAAGASGTVQCSIAQLDPGPAQEIRIDVTTTPQPNGTVLTNTATISGVNDPNATNDSSTATTAVVTRADLGVTITDAPDPVAPESALVYSVVVQNAGPDAAPNAVVTIDPAAGLTVASVVAPAGWTCGSGDPFTCTNPLFGVGSATIIVNTVSPAVSTAAGTTTSLSASITAAVQETNPGNESATQTTAVRPIAFLTGTKSASGSQNAGALVSFTIVLTNGGIGTQNDNPGDELVDVLPAGFDLVGATASSGSVLANVATRTVTWNGSIPAGGSVNITIEARVNENASGVLLNQATFHYDRNGDGTNESSGTTNAQALSAANIPALSPAMLLVLVSLLAGLSLIVLRRP